MPTSFSTSYVVPAILCNPLFILHGLNTFASRITPSVVSDAASPRQWLEPLGPVVGTELLLDVHSSDKFCWSYTILMVFVQILAFGRVSGNRVRRRSARAAAKLEKEKEMQGRKLSLIADCRPVDLTTNGHARGRDGLQDVQRRRSSYEPSGLLTPYTRTAASPTLSEELVEVETHESDESPLDTSEEETIV